VSIDCQSRRVVELSLEGGQKIISSLIKCPRVQGVLKTRLTRDIIKKRNGLLSWKEVHVSG
jgi:hypothetical protein